jgi:hypothetical protein
MTKTYDCAECGAQAPSGRLSCPSCGALLASVTGAVRPAVRISPAEGAPPTEAALPTASAAVAVAEATTSRANGSRANRRRSPVPPAPAAAEPPAETAAPVPVAPPPPVSAKTVAARANPAPSAVKGTAAAVAATEPANSVAASVTPVVSAEVPTATTRAESASESPAVPPALAGPRTPSYAPSPAAVARARTMTADPATTEAPAAPDAPTVAPLPTSEAGSDPAVPTGAPTDVAAAPVAPAAPAATAAPAAIARSDADRAAIVPLLAPSAIASHPPTPWAPLEEPAPTLVGRPYQRHLAAEPDAVVDGVRPPGAYHPPSQALSLAMAGALADANAARHADLVVDRSIGAGGAAGATAIAAFPKITRRWVTIPEPSRFVEIAGWFVVVGAAMSILGFLLPWSRVVIGASTFGGYFDGWGLANPTHLFVFVALLGVLALAVRREPVPAWISSGIFGLILGGLLLGLGWPYLVGPLGSDVGLTMTTLGGICLLIGGVVALWATRHGGVEPLV